MYLNANLSSAQIAHPFNRPLIIETQKTRTKTAKPKYEGSYRILQIVHF